MFDDEEEEEDEEEDEEGSDSDDDDIQITIGEIKNPTSNYGRPGYGRLSSLSGTGAVASGGKAPTPAVVHCGVHFCFFSLFSRSALPDQKGWSGGHTTN